MIMKIILRSFLEHKTYSISYFAILENTNDI